MKSLNVLIAEDNLVNQRLAAALLERHSASVTIVDNGRAAVEAWATRCFDLILMDIQMPEMDGLEATRRIRADERDDEHVPIVALTAHAMTGDREKCLAAGADAYLSKPVRAPELIETIDRLTGVSPLSNTLPLAPAEPIFDASALRDNLGGDETLFAELIALFLVEAPKHASAIRQGHATGDFGAAARAAHTLRGAAGAMTAGRVVEAAAEIETSGRVGSLEESMIQRLEASIEVLDTHLRASGLHPVAHPPALRASPVTTVPKTILVIDDDDSVRRVATRLLRREGHVVSDWASGEAALEMLAASVEPVDLLLTDTVMPGMNGIEAAARVLDLRPGIPVIFMSGYGQSVLDNARLAGSPSFVAKPFHADELIAAVREALGRGQQVAA